MWKLGLPEAVKLIDSNPSQPLLTREQWQLRVREAEMALEALEKKRGRPSALEALNLQLMKANPPKEFAPSPSGFKAAFGRLVVHLFPQLRDGFIINAWKAGRPPRLAPNPPGVDAAAQKAIQSVLTRLAPVPPLIQEGPPPKVGQA
jgi:hypothetical protein